MVRSEFDKELYNMHVDLDNMCDMVVQAIENCVNAYHHQDTQLAQKIINNDKDINDIERAIESKCLTLILKQQPIATDLRDISAVLKVVTDLERIGDQCADIADLIIELDEQDGYLKLDDITEMSSLAMKMVKQSMNAFHKYDLDLAKEVIQNDEDMDFLFSQVKMELVDLIQSQRTNIDLSIYFLMIAKYFEKIGDHAVNVCEWIEFYKTGQLDHQSLF